MGVFSNVPVVTHTHYLQLCPRDIVPIAILSSGERTGVFSKVPVVSGGALEILFPLL